MEIPTPGPTNRYHNTSTGQSKVNAHRRNNLAAIRFHFSMALETSFKDQGLRSCLQTREYPFGNVRVGPACDPRSGRQTRAANLAVRVRTLMLGTCLAVDLRAGPDGQERSNTPSHSRTLLKDVRWPGVFFIDSRSLLDHKSKPLAAHGNMLFYWRRCSIPQNRDFISPEEIPVM
ncbi:hypothetical protein IAQ61_001056 [Plenodomus lingam]|uniref:uncharacterized protein n=1 Tax=Leptosphaeria maculans TaxID=5022 RepID=UPI00331DA888|nr:hypothetical protein IAQ61_001056 [Plenodomus lingam]